MKLGLIVVGGLSRNPADGTIPALHWLVERLARRHEVHAFTLYGASRPDRYEFLGATVHHAGARRMPVRVLRSILAEHRRAPFAALHVFWLVPGGVIAATAGRLIRRPVLAHIGGGELVGIPEVNFGHQLYWRGRLWARLGLAGAARISAASAPVIEEIRRRGYRAERIPLGVDLGRWPVIAPRARRPGERARLVHVATLNRVKDQTTLLRAAKELADAGVEFQLDVAGPDTLAGAMPALAAQVGIGGRVNFHGYLPHERLYALVRDADMLWISSRFEAGPLVVLEAAVAGLPTVGTAVGHVAEWSPDAAVAVPVGDARALARETAALLGDEGRRLKLAREAQRRAIAQDADWTAARFEELYAEVVAATTGARPTDRAQ